ncbi:CPBP family intramembrane glutamic endopeptidase [Streptomyces sp. NPDC001046]|uniref:CPBP family intramembrane glutamic endopeptidase n=2 Tax=unclassified Streptomyces TaxID=2593676 RepID=UPI003642799D
MTTPTPGLPYHRLDHATGRHRWWRPPTGALLFLVTYVLAVLVLVAGSYVFGLAAGLPETADGDPDLGPLGQTAVDLVSLAVALPLVLLVVLWPGRRPVGTVSSVTGRLRAGWLARCLPVALLPVLLLTATAFLLPGPEGDGGSDTWVGWRSFLLSMTVLVLLVPFQAAAEEYVFRGWLTQAVGAFVRSPWIALLPQALLFAAAHGWGTPWGFAGLLVNGLVAGWLTVRTGGLEAAVALHVMNNLFAFGASAAIVGGLSSEETAADMPWQLTLVSVAADLLYAALVLRLARRHRPQRLAPPPVPPAPPLPPVPPPYPAAPTAWRPAP